MTEKHSISPDTDSTTSGVPALPDRSNLSKLYFEPKKATVTVDDVNHALDRINLSKTIQKYSITVGLLIPTPLIVTLVTSLLFIVFVNPGTVYLALPLMLVWGIAVVLLSRKVMKLLHQIDIPVVTFLSLQISCLMLTIPTISYVSQLASGPEWTHLVSISVLIFGMSVLFCWLFLQLILNNSLTDKIKFRLAGLIVLTCLVSAVIYMLFRVA